MLGLILFSHFSFFFFQRLLTNVGALNSLKSVDPRLTMEMVKTLRSSHNPPSTLVEEKPVETKWNQYGSKKGVSNDNNERDGVVNL